MPSGTLEGFTIERGSFGRGCLFSPERVLAWSHEDHTADESALEQAWNAIVVIFGEYAGIVDAFENVVVDGATTLLSAGRYPFADPLAYDHASDSNACTIVRGVCRTALYAALAALGYPASGGTAAAVVGEGASYVEATTAEYLASTSAGPVASALIQLGVNEATGRVESDILARLQQQQLQAVHCTDPVASQALLPYAALFAPSVDLLQRVKNYQAISAQHGGEPALLAILDRYAKQGYFIDGTSCANAPSNPFTWGGWDAAHNPHGAILWLRVTRNPSGTTIPQPQRIEIHDTAGMYDDAFVDVPVDTMGASIDVPVLLAPNYDRYHDDPRVKQSFGSGTSYDVTQQELLWEEEIAGTFAPANSNVVRPPASMSLVAGTQYRWSQTQTSVGDRVSTFWGTFGGGVGSVLGSEHQPAVYAPCTEGII